MRFSHQILIVVLTLICTQPLYSQVPVYAVPPNLGLGIKKAVITHNQNSPTLVWANGQLQITAVGKYNYRNDYTFVKLVVEVVWTRAAGAPLNLNGPTLNFTPEASLPAPPNFTLALPPLLPPAGYTDCIVKVRIIVTKLNTPDETDVHGVSVTIPPKPKAEE